MKQRQKSKNGASYKKFSKQSDSEDEETELFTRKKTPKRQIATVDKVVEDGDTLQSLSIRYNCTIEDLKRLNNIHKENEIFAKGVIKVPYHAIMMATLAGVHSGTNSPPKNEPSTSANINSSNILSKKLSSTLINLSKDSEVNEIIFNSHIAQKAQEVEKEIEDDETHEEVNLLPKENVTVVPISRNLHWSGVDGDISLKVLMCFIIIVIFAVPLIYVFYIAEHPEQYHHPHHIS